MKKPRYIALTDISTAIEVDDRQSLIRLLLYSNEIQIEGLIAVTSCFLKNGAKKHNENIIHSIINKYKCVRNNLLIHDENYPSSDYLHSVTARGINAFGKSVGNGFCEEKYCKNSGVRLIIDAVDKEESPLYIGLWGGANTLAQAIWTAEKEKSENEFNNFLSKFHIYSISDQDYAGKWIRDTYANKLVYIVSPSPPDRNGSKEYYKATWGGISADKNGHGSENGINKTNGFSGADFNLISNKWIKKNIKAISPYGKIYPYTRFIAEGDSPSFLWLINNGLNDFEHIEYGSWGGRYTLQKPENEKYPIFTTANDRVIGIDNKLHNSPQASIWRWREEFQNDFAARMLWTIKDKYELANHNPTAETDNKIIYAKAGEQVILKADASDPNGGTLSYQWFHYPEATGNDFYLDLSDERSNKVRVTVPKDAKNDMHIILKVKNSGTPPLSTYIRFIIKFERNS